MSSMQAAGRLIEIARFPVKSMAGESLETVGFGWAGMSGDRQYGFVRRGNATRFPWLTGRDLSQLVLHRAAYDTPDDPRTSAVTVTTPAGARHALRDPDLIAGLERDSAMPLDLLQLGRGAFDTMPVSIVTTASLRRLDSLCGRALDRRRFRSNLVVESDALDLDWRGCRIRLGDASDGVELVATHPAPRCAMITIDPDDATRDASVLRTVAREFDTAFAMYATVSRPGVVRLGDAVTVTPI